MGYLNHQDSVCLIYLIYCTFIYWHLLNLRGYEIPMEVSHYEGEMGISVNETTAACFEV
jgi:hypothetical protein